MKALAPSRIQAILVLVITITLIACGNTGRHYEAKDSVSAPRTEGQTSEPAYDDDFTKAAADGGMLEVELGKLAVANGTSSEVKRLGQMMVTDHGRLNDQLRLLAQKRNITLPSTLSHKNQEKYDILSKKKGAEFDKDYATLMITTHEEDIAAFKNESEKGKDNDLKSWAEGEIPLLEHHLEVSNFTLHPVKNK